MPGVVITYSYQHYPGSYVHRTVSSGCQAGVRTIAGHETEQ